MPPCGRVALWIISRPMSNAADPRQIAELYRRLANIPTSGGHRADRLLQTLAEKLDREAAEAKPPAARAPKSNPR